MSINANRHLDRCRPYGVPVWSDARAELRGPLAGILVALQRCTTPYLATVPCDLPPFPLDLVARLAGALSASGADLAWAQTGSGDSVQSHPLCCLMHCRLACELQQYLEQGDRQVERWFNRCASEVGTFPDGSAFANANTETELQALESSIRR